MSSFEFVTVLVSVIVGLGVTHLLTGLGRAVHHRARESLWWVHLCWTATILLYLAIHWWNLFFLRDDSVWSFLVYLYILFHSILIFFLAIDYGWPELGHIYGDVGNIGVNPLEVSASGAVEVQEIVAEEATEHY